MMDAITIETVRVWAKELARLREEEQARQRKIADLERKLGAAAILGLVADEKPYQAPIEFAADDGAEGSELGLPNAITTLMRRIDGNISPPELRKRLIAEGVDERRFGTNSSYFYTTLGRLVKRGILKKRGKNYSIAA